MAGRFVQFKDFVDPETGEVRKFLIIEPKVKDCDFIKIRKALTEATLKDLDYLNGAVKLLMWFLDKKHWNTKCLINPPKYLFSLTKQQENWVYHK